MNLSKLSAVQLAQLISDASAELSARLAAPGVQRVKPERAVVVLREPAEEDKDFVLRLKTTVMSGGYVSASDRQRIADLAVEFGPWIKRQGLPTERGTWAWRKLAENARISPAKDR